MASYPLDFSDRSTTSSTSPANTCTSKMTWEGFEEDMLEALEEFYRLGDFVDVTLICDDLTIRAHRIVLAASSDFFERLLIDSDCKHPVILLNGFQGWELEACVEFMYRGVVQVPYDKVAELVTTAGILEIRGLADYVTKLEEMTMGLRLPLRSTASPILTRDSSVIMTEEPPLEPNMAFEFDNNPRSPKCLNLSMGAHLNESPQTTVAGGSSSVAVPGPMLLRQSPLRRKQARPRRRSGDYVAQDLRKIDPDEDQVIDYRTTGSNSNSSPAKTSNSSQREDNHESPATPPLSNPQTAPSTPSIPPRAASTESAQLPAPPLPPPLPTSSLPPPLLLPHLNSQLHPDHLPPIIHQPSPIRNFKLFNHITRENFRTLPNDLIVMQSNNNNNHHNNNNNNNNSDDGISSSNCVISPPNSPPFFFPKASPPSPEERHACSTPPIFPPFANGFGGPLPIPGLPFGPAPIFGRHRAQHSAPRGGPPRAWSNADLTEALHNVWNKKMTTSQASRIFGIPYNSLLMYVRGKYGKSLKLDLLKKGLDMALEQKNNNKSKSPDTNPPEFPPFPPAIFGEYPPPFPFATALSHILPPPVMDPKIELGKTEDLK